MKLLERVRRLKFHGLGVDAFDRQTQGRAPQAEVLEPGFKYNLTDISAALGLEQLEKLDDFIARRTELAHYYRERLSEIDEILPLGDVPYPSRHAWHLFIVRLLPNRAGLDRNQFMAALKEKNIGTGLHFRAVHSQKYYRETLKLSPGALPQTEWNSARICSLPLFPQMTRERCGRRGRGNQGGADHHEPARLVDCHPGLQRAGDPAGTARTDPGRLPPPERPFELILVDDGSSDDSARLICQAAEQEPEVVAVLLNRNYGQHAAVFAGLQQSCGEVVVTLDADLQNPPEEIPNLLRETDAGADVVGTVRDQPAGQLVPQKGLGTGQPDGAPGHRRQDAGLRLHAACLPPPDRLGDAAVPRALDLHADPGQQLCPHDQ